MREGTLECMVVLQKSDMNLQLQTAMEKKWKREKEVNMSAQKA